MDRELVLTFLAVLASGSIVTLISGSYKQDLSHRLGVSITSYGFPLSWYRESYVVYPGSPVVHSFSWESFALDTAFWSLVIGVLIVVVFGLVRISYIAEDLKSSTRIISTLGSFIKIGL